MIIIHLMLYIVILIFYYCMIRFLVYCICICFKKKQMKDFRILYCGKENKIDKYKNKAKNTEKIFNKLFK